MGSQWGLGWVGVAIRNWEGWVGVMIGEGRGLGWRWSYNDLRLGSFGVWVKVGIKVRKS